MGLSSPCHMHARRAREKETKGMGRAKQRRGRRKGRVDSHGGGGAPFRTHRVERGWESSEAEEDKEEEEMDDWGGVTGAPRTGFSHGEDSGVAK